MSLPDPYAQLALVYDDWQYLYRQPFCLSLRPRMIRVLEEFSVPRETYADLGCGTGIFAAWWKHRFPDWRVFGLDRSPAMIRQAEMTATRGAQKQALLHWGLSTRSVRAVPFDQMMAEAEALQARTEPTEAGEATWDPPRRASPNVGSPQRTRPEQPEQREQREQREQPERPEQPPRAASSAGDLAGAPVPVPTPAVASETGPQNREQRKDAMTRETGPSVNPPSRSGVEFRVQAIHEIDLPEPLGLATCLFDGINHITRTADLEAAFRAVGAALVPGGLFVFDLVHEDIFEEAFSGSVIRKGPGLVVTAESIHFTRSDALFGRTTFAIFREEGEAWQRYDAEISERCWTRREIRAALRSAGLAVLRQDDIDPLVETEFQLPRTFWVCRRPMEGRIQ